MSFASLPRVSAPAGTSRLIPSRFPPIGAFDTVASSDDLEAVMELEGWTNDRLVAPRLKRLPEKDWVYGRPNASIVMAAFLHGSPGELRFSGPELGAWYASTEIETAILEVANGIRREIALSALTQKIETFRRYVADLAGTFIDILGSHSEYHDPDVRTYPASQALGKQVRDAPDLAGIRYESVRRPGHENWVCYRPPLVQNVLQSDHLRLEVPATGKVVVRRLTA